MPPTTTFGRRVQAQHVPRPLAARTQSAPSANAVPSLPSRADQTQLPFLTIGLIALLVAIFCVEISRGHTGSWMSLTVPSLIAFGGNSGTLVFGAHQWWRIFTAPMLHVGPGHLLGNCVVLYFAGRYLEPVIGMRWFAALYAISGVAGSLASLGTNAPLMVSVGASGAITGLLAAMLFCSHRAEDAGHRSRMQIVAVRLLIPALLPSLLAGASESHVDYGAHIGGALAGFAVSFVVAHIWDSQTRRPRLRSLAAGIAGAAALITAASFSLAATQDSHTTIAAYTPAGLIPQNEIPADAAAWTQRYSDLLARYPNDPRGHFYRAVHLYEQRDTAEAADELRAAIALTQAKSDTFQPRYLGFLKMTLALVIQSEGDLQAARDEARDSCSQAEPDSKLLQTLRSKNICD